MMILRALSVSMLLWLAISATSARAASVAIQPGDTRTTRTPLGLTSFDSALL